MAERRFTNKGTSRVQVETREDGGATITGYAAVFYDSGNDGTEFEIFSDYVERIMPGAFDEALKRPDDAAGLFNHQPDNLLGRVSAGTLSLSVDKTGLRYEIDAPDTTVGRDVVASIKRGDLTGSSFAFTVTDQTFRTEEKIDIREIRGVELFDTGPVTYPAYEATTTGVRATDGADDAVAARRTWHAEQRRDRMAAGTTDSVRKFLTDAKS